MEWVRRGRWTQRNLHTTPSFYSRLSATFMLCWADFSGGVSFIDSRWAQKGAKFRMILIKRRQIIFSLPSFVPFGLAVKSLLGYSGLGSSRIFAAFVWRGLTQSRGLVLFAFVACMPDMALIINLFSVSPAPSVGELIVWRVTRLMN